jgi:hypothetical protein
MTATPEKITNPLQGIATELYKQGKLEPAYGYFDDLHQCQAAEIEKLKDDLQFVERWAVHHGTKSHVTPENVLSVIQHYPAITTITESYTDGKVPDTFNPYAEIAELKAQLPLSSNFIQTVPDKCDRIVWRNHYYHLPIKPATLTPISVDDGTDEVYKEYIRLCIAEGMTERDFIAAVVNTVNGLTLEASK